MSAALAKLQEAGVIDALDVVFGDWIAGRSDETTGLAAALVSAEVAKGHVCLDLDTAADMLRAQDITPPKDWRTVLAQSGAVAEPGGRAPLVLDGVRLYLHRYWRYETSVAEALLRLAVPVAELDLVALKTHLRELFPAEDELDHQALAAVLGATRRLAIVSGGPGTGKTTTVLKLIALALMLDPGLTIALAAPTGKAAGRLAEVFAANEMPTAVRERLPGEPQTLHRLLGYNSARQTIRHDAATPLAADLVVVDEASMVDLGLMARLLAALKPGARLVLVGDRDQLASVEAGAVLGDICLAAAGFPENDAALLDEVLGAPVPRAEGKLSPISASIALLKRNYRFGEQGIGSLAKAVVAGNVDTALALLSKSTSSPFAPEPPSSPSPLAAEPSSSPSPLAGEGWGEGHSRKAAATKSSRPPTSRESESAEQLVWRPIANERQLAHDLARIAETHFKPVLNAASAGDALTQLNRFRLLAAERKGTFGVEGLNARVGSLLGVHAADAWYRGRPVLITENDYELELFNGDFGIAWPADDKRTMLWTAGTDGELRAIFPARLPAHETCYALTVHKAQGSEFDRVALVLPPRESAVATRELLYTGITRARKGVELWATEPALRTAIARRIRRASGLAARLTGVAP
ncbi:MAG: exodeoxyribonuclease V subunit alpha [Gammaproteobacteria bacterium]